jgi:hypothetical protein
MAEEQEKKKFSVQTAKGRIPVECPVCGGDQFLDIGPAEDAQRRGFRHVVVGVSGENHLAWIPVRFKFCENCGFILQFVIQSGGGGDAK